MRIAYLLTRYPAISHTFILREVLELRRLGVGIDTFSIRRARRQDLLAPADHEAFATTFAILPPHPARLLWSHLVAAMARPVRYLGTLGLALRLSPRGLRGRLWQCFYFAEAIVVWRECRTRGLSHIHVHFTNVPADVALLAAHFGTTRGREWSWSFTLHGSVEFYEITQSRFAEKVNRARFVVCISDFARSQAMAFADEEQWSKIHVVHCGLDPADFEPGDRPAGAKPGRPLQLLTVGRLIDAKAQALIVDAIAELRRRGVDARLTLIGEGPKRPALERRVRELELSDRVVLAGAVGHDRMHEHYRQADVFCLSSLAEGLPVVLMEAMAMELPVVATRITGIPELVEHGVTGLLTAPGRSDQLADALQQLADPDLRAAMGAAGRAVVVEQFNSKRSARELLAIFEASLAGDPPLTPRPTPRAARSQAGPPRTPGPHRGAELPARPPGAGVRSR